MGSTPFDKQCFCRVGSVPSEGNKPQPNDELVQSRSLFKRDRLQRAQPQSPRRRATVTSGRLAVAGSVCLWLSLASSGSRAFNVRIRPLPNEVLSVSKFVI